jgi:hypothetical protein
MRIRDLLNENSIYKTLEVKEQYDCRIKYLKYFRIISIIKNKNIAQKTESGNVNTLIDKI